ncbi:thiol reductant ABC exporter subunit CydC [Amycolatopsis sp. CA-230715]|uniref:thiol reductant ABC exporter subunit CydC n=1 Tax=Amycolatopsis sp. CA-230715 TaxID=2745196 RepID=UPI001C037697|nr:thiol reductant ABC exporter subunit CydC [Amycolatopsis sp. CA-230715]QWF80263.1 Vitamin B12 import ATP-binding protein BtuD [Amycolatopsis sp. CA-230715]
MTGLSRRAPLSASVSTVDTARTGKGPLGALPALSVAARRALALAGMIAVVRAGSVVAQGFLLASVLASIVQSGTGDFSARLAALLGVLVVRSLAGWALKVVSARAAAGVQEELRAKVVDRTLRLGPEWIAARGTGELTALSTRGLDALDAYFTEYLPALVTAAVVPPSVGFAILVADWPSAAVIALTVPLLPAFAILIGKYTADRVSTATDAVHRLSGHLLELVRALPVLTAFRRAAAQETAVRRVSDRHRKATLSTLRIAFSSAFALELAATLSVALVAVLIGTRLVSGDLTLAIGLGVLILAPECYQPIRTVGAAFHASEDGVEAVRRVAEILDEDEEIPEFGHLASRRGGMRVDGLRVARRDGYAPDGATFTVRPGETTWLDSPSGAGKTTTLAVLLGFLRPADGTVTVDGIPLADLDLDEWRRRIAWVPQAPVFTGGTVRAEIGDYRGDLLGLDGLLDRSVDQLSLGQRHRVAVLRALARIRDGAWLLLLDEPTAHLDATDAARVLAAVDEARRAGAAVVIAAHDRDAAVHAPAAPVTADPVEQTEEHTTPIRLRALVNRRLVAGVLLGAAALLSGLALTATSGWLIAKASQHPPILTLTVAIVGVRAFGLGRAVLRYAERLATHDAAFRAATELRAWLWRRLVAIGPARTLGLRRGEGQRRLVGDVDTVRDLVPRVLTPPMVAAIVLVGAVVLQAILLPSAGLALAIAVVAAATLAPWLAVRMERRATATMAALRRTVEADVLRLNESAAELIAYGTATARRAELARADRELASAARRQAWGAGAADAVITLLTGAAAIAGAAAAIGAGIDPVLAPVLALVPLALAEPLAMLPAAAVNWAPLRRARERLGALTGDPHESAPESAAVDLRGAAFRWPGAARPVLTDVDLRIEPGTTVAVVGASGEGKSTLLAALLGFLPAERGRASLPRDIAWAPQEPQLVATTIAENLRLADPDASDARLREVLDAVLLGDLAPETQLGSGGAGLSGGQARRLAVARALLAAPHADLVLLDEPTAHLDGPTADAVSANLRAALAGRTVVHVTHHASEAADADLVLEVREGRVTAREPAHARSRS